MLKGEYIYVDLEHRNGISTKNGQPYNFANVTLSDGLESFTQSIDPELVPSFNGAQRGDKVQISVQITAKKSGNEFKIIKTNLLSSVSK